MKTKFSYLAIAVSAALFLISVCALVVQELGWCGTCSADVTHDRAIGLAGCVGYALLTIIGVLGYVRTFAFGAAVAAGVHTVLFGKLLESGSLCAICLLAALTAALLVMVVLAQAKRSRKLVAWGYLPTVLVATLAATAFAAKAEAAKLQFAQFLAATRADGAPLTVRVFEQAHCPYCQDFRDYYLPRLQQEFGDRLQVSFLPATAAAWVRRTPTIAVEAGEIFEGLPANYSDLRAAVSQALAARK